MRKICHLLFLALSVMMFSCKPIAKAPDTGKLIPVSVGKKWGYIDRQGKMVIETKYLYTNCFNEGLANVAVDGEKPGWGYIDESGKLVIPASYALATPFNEGIAFVVARFASPTAIGHKGEVKFSLPDAEEVYNFNEGLAAFSSFTSNGLKWGFIDKTGKTVIVPQFSATRLFQHGFCPVKNEDDKWGLIDTKGNLVLNYQFDNLLPFSEDKWLAAIDKKYGIVDNQGKFIVNPQFESARYDEGMYIVKENDKWGWIDMNGKITITPQFDMAYPFLGNKYASAKIGSKYGYIDQAGKIIINPQFDAAGPFDGEIAAVGINDKIGFIDNMGKYVVNPQFDALPQTYDYLMNGRKSAFANFQVTSNDLSATKVVWRFLNAITNQDFATAVDMSDETSHELIRNYVSLMGGLSEEGKKRLKKKKLLLSKIREEGNLAVASYIQGIDTIKDEVKLFKNSDGYWVVHWGSN